MEVPMNNNILLKEIRSKWCDNVEVMEENVATSTVLNCRSAGRRNIARP
jgi:hypothetical protein